MNFKMTHMPVILNKVEAYFLTQALVIDKVDGLSMAFKDWRFNIRGSNTESLLRLNIESRGQVGLVKQQLALLERLIAAYDVPSEYCE